IFASCQSKSETEIKRRAHGIPDSKDQSIRTPETEVQESRKTAIRTAEGSEVKNKAPYFVYKVVDGDTFWMTDENKLETKVRLIGIDSPETRNTRKKKKGYYGKEAKEYLQNLILNK